MPLAISRAWRGRGRRPRAGLPRNHENFDHPLLNPPPESGPRSASARYAIAAGFTLLAFFLEHRHQEFFRPANFLLFYPCVFIAAVLGGPGPSIVSIALSAAGAYWIFHDAGIQAAQPEIEKFLRLAAFVGFAGFGCWLIGRGRRAEAALRESARHLRIFRALADNSSDFIGIADPDGIPLYVNPAGRALVGLSAETPVDRTRIPEYYPPDTRAFATNVILRKMREQGHWKGETFFRNFSTEDRIPVWDEHFMIRDADGRVLGMGTVTRDLSERRRAEEALQRAQEEVHALRQRERFLLALEAAATAMIIVARDGGIIFANSEAERLFGWSKSELQGQKMEVLIPQRFRAGHSKLREGFFNELTTRRPMGVGRELSALRKDGAEFPVEIGLTRFTDHGTEDFVVASIVDITQRKAAEKTLRENEEKLKRGIVELEAFAHTISHDLRSPLRAIEGNAYFLSQRLASSPDPEVRAMLGRTRRAAARLDMLIRDLLSYNAVARQTVELGAVDLDETLSHISEHYPDIAKARPRVRSPLGRALGHQSLLIQTFSNLLSNAVKFVPPGRAPEIEVWSEREEGRLAVIVQDNGIGIPREAWERVFKPFERLRAAAPYEGTGIGLAIVKRAVEKMGGAISLESEPGRGSRFRVSLKEA